MERLQGRWTVRYAGIGLLLLAVSLVACSDEGTDAALTWHAEQLGSDDVEARRRAGHGLAALGPRAAPAAAALAGALADEDEVVRQWAGEALARIGAPAVPHLIGVLNEGSPVALVGAARALAAARVESEEAAEALLAAGETDDAPLRIEIIRALEVQGDAASAAVPWLIRQLDDDDESVQLGAAELLGRLGPAARTALPYLMALAGTGSAASGAAAEAYHRLGGEAVAEHGALLENLVDENPAVRRAAAWLIGENPKEHEVVVPLLLDRLTDEDESVRRAALVALRAYRPEGGDAVAAIGKALREDQSESVRGAAAEALAVMGTAGVAVLADELASGEEGTIRVALTHALGNAGAEGVEVLVQTLASDSWYTRLYALRGLARAGAGARGVMPAILARLDDENTSVRVAAAETIRAVDRREPASLRALVEILSYEDVEHRILAADALGRFGGEAREPLRKALAAVKEEAKQPGADAQMLGVLEFKLEQSLMMVTRPGAGTRR